MGGLLRGGGGGGGGWSQRVYWTPSQIIEGLPPPPLFLSLCCLPPPTPPLPFLSLCCLLGPVCTNTLNFFRGNYSNPIIILQVVFGLGLACQVKGLSCHTKNQPLLKYLWKKKGGKVRSTACHYATKKTHLNNNVFGFGLHN